MTCGHGNIIIILKHKYKISATHRRPVCGAGRAAHAADDEQLRKLLVGLEQRLLGEELAEDAAAAPHVDGGAVTLLAQQQLGGSADNTGVTDHAGILTISGTDLYQRVITLLV